ncbi:MAG: cytochrome c oxidase assembly protein [Acidimicrobiales bacterium]
MLSAWSLSPVGLVAICALIAHEVGSARLRARSTVPRPQRALRAWCFRGGVAVVVVCSVTPLAHEATRVLWLHMVDHVVLMFFAPAALVAGGPVVPLCWSLPPPARRRALRGLMWSGPGRGLRAAWGFAARPPVAFCLLNATMVLWHLPRLLDAALSTWLVRDLAMEPSFVVVGILFWRSILSSHPYPPLARLRTQAVMVVGTNLVMLVLAMSLAIFTTHAWYTVPGSEHLSVAAAFSAQQLAAGVLWICGDFWAGPALVLIVVRLIRRDGSLFDAFERELSARAAA